MLLMVLVACSNLNDRAFNAEGGSRHATGEWNGWEGDTASDTGGGGGGGDTDIGDVTDDSPVIAYVVAVFGGTEEEPVVDATITYNDPQDDLDGGTVNFFYASGDGGDTFDNRAITADTSYDTNAYAGWLEMGTIELQITGVDITKDFHLTEVILEDAAGNASEAVDAETVEAEQ